ncbi:MAG: transketolase [Verrucomicrobia bacterium]|nr:transketolase [Verrucomicrobiota bacterium]MDE3098219.1 transketolase [Verrucomicrobiota bacterium]
MIEIDIELLKGVANQLRIHSINATTAAGSGHPTSCCSAADLVATLFFGHMKFNPKDPHYYNNDRFILSKGHAAPLLYAAWAETGLIPAGDLAKLRAFDSDLEGHPTPRLPFVDVATGSLGQGLSVGAGMALAARLDQLDYNTYVLLGDGEIAEGSVWEAASFAGIYKLNNLIAIVDDNRLGQSQATAFGHDTAVYAKRFDAFGWRVEVIDGHDIEEIVEVLNGVRLDDKPLAIIAKTYKGAGVSFLQDKDGWHGKPLNKDEAARAVAELQPTSRSGVGVPIAPPAQLPEPKNTPPESYPPLNYNIGDSVATREAYGNALARVGEVDHRVVAMDGDTKNSTFSDKFLKKFPNRFTECFIAEQNLIGVATGFGTRGKVPFASAFAAFFTRAGDQLRVAGISRANLKLAGSHVGVSIGEDGPSQMGLEDLALMRAIAGSTVLYPADAVAAEKLVEQMALGRGIYFLRTSRPKTPVIYQNDEKFPVGGAKTLRQNPGDKATVVAAGVTLCEALKAADALKNEGIGITVIDAYSIKPLARADILAAAKKTNHTVITVEDHYPEGGLGDAVAGELSVEGVKVHKLAVASLPRSGKAVELLAHFGIDAAAIVKKVKSL